MTNQTFANHGGPDHTTIADTKSSFVLHTALDCLMYLQKGVGTETGRCFLLEESARLEPTNNKINEAGKEGGQKLTKK